MTEIDAMKAIETAMGAVEDPKARDRVLRWAWDRYASGPIPAREGENGEAGRGRRGKKRGGVKKNRRKDAKSRGRLSIVKDLNLRPDGKRSLLDFAKDKRPASNLEKCVVAIYYLRHELGREPTDADQVFTCFKYANWRIPANLENTLQYIASQRGWLDTSNMSDIRLTPLGENLVEHDLPRPTKGDED